MVGAVLMALGFAVVPAFAGDAGGPMSQKVRIELRGEVTPQCMLNGLGAHLDLGSLSADGAPGQKELTFRLSCNAPFSYSLTSEFGALRHEEMEAANGFAAGFPYRAKLSIPTDEGSTLTLDCGGAELDREDGTCEGQSGAETAIEQDALITVKWGPIAERLMAGRYRDELRIAFSIGN